MAAIALGAVCFGVAVVMMPLTVLNYKYLFVLAFGVAVAPRMTLTLPRSNFAISFSDALTLLTFLLFGGPAAIVVAVAETLANCLYLRAKDFRRHPLKE